MFATRLVLTISVLCISSAVTAKKACDFEDSNCLTAAANRVFEQIISGMPGVEPSDPLQTDLIEVNLPSLNYKVIDGKLSGMRQCKVKLVKINTKELKYDYHIECPHLILESEYELKAETGTQYIEGKGTSRTDLYGYHFLFHGDFVINESKEEKMHLNLKTHQLEQKLNGKVHYKYKNILIDDQQKSDALQRFASENWESVVKRALQPAMEAFMNQHITNKNAYLAIVPIQDIFYAEK